MQVNTDRTCARLRILMGSKTHLDRDEVTATEDEEETWKAEGEGEGERGVVRVVIRENKHITTSPHHHTTTQVLLLSLFLRLIFRTQ
ncbi:hypothetical protein E2C01_004409 [Portunus trituberculatus]|uniref:Uncharacterized protein n=1 Tax=Portunus trituberculatus TaxID=210409 RepID=A0A5B7CRB1_PORTR|nr:hypothetical protein [Portunus trituberculatus]